MELFPLGRFDWERHVRPIQMKPMTKLVAFALATYANKGGERIHPGNKRLALELGIHERTVERHIDWLRKVGLLEQTYSGRSAGRRGMANTYRLVVAADLADRVTVLDTETPDTGVGSYDDEDPTPESDDLAGTPDAAVGTSDPNTRHGDAEHPTPVSGTPDTSVRTPDTRVGTPSNEHQPSTSRVNSSSGDSVADEPRTIDADMEVIKRLPRDDQERLWNEISQAVDDDTDWPTLVHLAAQRVASEAVA